MSDPEGARQDPGKSEPPADERGKRGLAPRWRKVIGVGVSLVVLALMLVGVIPKFASYSGAWSRTVNLDTWRWLAIAAIAVVGQISGVWPYLAALPGLRFRHGFVQIETTSAISSTVPAGGAVAIRMTYKMFSSFGFSDVAISSAVVTTGIWNMAAKFGLPIAAVALLAMTGHPTGAVVGAAIGGVIAFIGAGVALWLVQSEPNARWIGRLADRVVNWLLHFFHKPAANRIEHSLLRFRGQTVDTVHSRGWRLTGTTLASQLVALLLVLVIVWAVGITSREVTFAAVLTSFASARLAGAVPVTPGGLGTIDATFIAMLTTFGAKSTQALAADLVWRLTTYFLPIFLGVVTYVIWIRWMERSVATAPADRRNSSLGTDD